MITFELKNHRVLPGVKIVEVLLDGQVCAVIYPEPDAIKIVTAHYNGHGLDLINPDIPAIHLGFKFKPFPATN